MNSAFFTPSSGTVSSRTIYARLKAGLSASTYNGELFTATSTGATTRTVTCNGTVSSSNLSDLFLVPSSSPTIISSLINNTSPLSSSTGIQVLQFKVRDGGALLSDADNLPTILTAFSISQVSNTISTWSDAIQTIELFDGTSNLATGNVTATQIQFTGLNINVADNTEKTLTLRLSLKCPLGADAFDNERFGFSISNTNTTFSSSGSGKTTFTAVQNTVGTNTIQVNATQLAFTTQPSTTGVSIQMSNVIVSAIDNCGNLDLDFNGSVSINSTGTLSSSPTTISASSGTATFSNLTHTVTGSGLTLTATSSGLTSVVSNLFNITTVTTLQKGDLAVLAVNTNVSGGSDEVVFVCFQDILPGTTFYITDNGYERNFANMWGGTEGVITLTRTNSTLPKGTIIVFKSNTGNVTSASHFNIYTCGAIDNNWNKNALSGSLIGGFNLNSDDDMWIMQGGTWNNSTSHMSTYTGGNVLYGWTESGWNSVVGLGNCINGSGDATDCTRWSTIFPGLECYNTVAPTGNGFVKFNDPVNPDFSTLTNGQLDWIALINNTANWDTFTDNTTYTSGGYNYLGNTTCPQLTIVPTGYVNGKWTGKQNTDWFNCGNWDTLLVPDETVDVLISDNTYNNQAIIDITSPNAIYYGNTAKTKDLTITGEKVEITNSSSNVLEVHGNLSISGIGILDMNDSNPSTNDGILYLSGNWNNLIDDNAFDEGNGTVILNGTGNQIISSLGSENTEQFATIIFNNNFNTSLSNNIIANENAIINLGKTVVIDNNDYLDINKNLILNGTLTIENNGSLIQRDDSGINTIGASGVFNYKRNALLKKNDYIQWSSPVQNFHINNVSPLTSNYKYKYLAKVNANVNTHGTYIFANEIMTPGNGYLVGAPDNYTNSLQTFNALFTGNPNNGLITPIIERGTYVGADYNTGLSPTLATEDDDNWNLIGNPYPSAIFADDFLNANPSLDEHINLWKHGISPSNLADPFYNDYALNYSVSDFLTYNQFGGTQFGFDGKIASGNSFFTLMLDTSIATNETATFSNSMRKRTNRNDQFFRTNTIVTKDRIWLDLIAPNNQSSNILFGYCNLATDERDRLYDAKTSTSAADLIVYTLNNNNKYAIQAKQKFNESDTFSLGYKTKISGNFKIALNHLDGIFQTQNIYLVDLLLNQIHDLKSSPYSFSTQAKEDNNRFKIIFRNKILNELEHIITNDIVITTNISDLLIISNTCSIKDVSIYNLLGQNIFTKTDVNSSIFTINKNLFTNQSLLIKVTLDNNQTFTKKIIVN